MQAEVEIEEEEESALRGGGRKVRVGGLEYHPNHAFPLESYGFRV